jgi:hypothetical protein
MRVEAAPGIAAKANCDVPALTVNSGNRHSEKQENLRKKGRNAATIVPNGADSIFECLVLDETTDGIFVDMGTVVDMPREVIIQCPSGALSRAVRRWASGTKVGFELVGPPIIQDETSLGMQTVSSIIRDRGIVAAIETLRVVRFFDNEALQRMAEAAEFAIRQFG